MELASEMFTNRTQAVKCATLEIEPIGRTRTTIEEQRLFETDESLLKRISVLKPFADRFIIQTTNKTLSDTNGYDFAEAYKKYQKRNDKNNGKENYDKICEHITKIVLEKLKNVTGYSKENMLVDEKFYSSAEFRTWARENCSDIPGYDTEFELKGLGTLLNTSYKWTVTALTKWMPLRVIENMELYFENIPIVERFANEGTGLEASIEELISTFCLPENYALCLSGEGLCRYNRMISGDNDASGIVNKGLGIYVNEKNQEIRNDNLKIKRYRAPKPLYKQILSPTPKAFEIETIETNQEFLDVLDHDIQIARGCISRVKNIFDELSNDTTISGSSINYLAANILSGKEFDVFTKLIMDDEKIKSKTVRGKRYSFGYLTQLKGVDVIELTKEAALKKAENLLNKIHAIENSQIKNLTTVKESDTAIRKVVELCDAVSELRRYIMIFGDDSDDADDFCNDCLSLKNDLFACTKATNLMRNFATRSLKSEAKKKPCLFGCGSRFSSGWWTAEDKFSARDLTVAKIDDKYYLLMVPGGHKPVDIKSSENGTVQLYVTKKLQKMQFCIPATAFPPEVRAYFQEGNTIPYVLNKGMTEPVIITREVWDIYSGKLAMQAQQEENHLTDEQVTANRTKLLSLYRKIATKGTQFQKFDMKSLKMPEEYRTVAEFNADAESRNINMAWMNVDKDFIEKCVENGDLLMFLIKNKNMYFEGERSVREALTSYAEIFLSIFSDTNMSAPRLIINAAPSFYYRPKMFEPKVTHPKGSILVNKKDKNGKHIPDDIYAELYHFYNGRLEKNELSDGAKQMLNNINTHVADEDIIKDAHYAREMFTMTFSYTINKHVCEETGYYINRDVDAFLNDSNIMVVSKGITDLVYYIIYDKNGKIIKEGNLNSIDRTNYLDLLREYTQKRREDKATMWKYDTKVSGIKDYYVKHVSGRIAQIAIENNAIVVLEKTSKKMREKYSLIDHQVFGKLEDALRVKMENCVLPHVKDPMAPGGRLNPLQLAYDIKGNNKGALKLFGSMLCNVADITTGFVNAFDLYDMNSVIKKRQFLAIFNEIKFTEKGLIFRFDYNTKDMPLKMIEQSSEKKSEQSSEKKSEQDSGKKFMVDPQKLIKSEWTVTADGARSLYDEKMKTFNFVDNIAEYVQEKFITAGDETGGNIVDHINEISNSSISALFDALTATLSCVVRSHDNEEEYRFSPITNENLGNCNRYKAQAIYSRFMFFRAHPIEKDEEDDRNEEWLNNLLFK